MFDVLDEINYQSYNDFVLRVGRCLPLMGGVQGQCRPVVSEEVVVGPECMGTALSLQVACGHGLLPKGT